LPHRPLAEGRPVTVRLLDAGADKPIAGYTVDVESNPFLGLRGVRLSLLHRQVLSTQLRALARAAAVRPLQIMVPMVTWPDELDQVRQMLDDAVESLTKEGLDCVRPALGMMGRSARRRPHLRLVQGRFLLDRVQRPDTVRDGLQQDSRALPPCKTRCSQPCSGSCAK